MCTFCNIYLCLSDKLGPRPPCPLPPQYANVSNIDKYTYVIWIL